VSKKILRAGIAILVALISTGSVVRGQVGGQPPYVPYVPNGASAFRVRGHTGPPDANGNPTFVDVRFEFANGLVVTADQMVEASGNEAILRGNVHLIFAAH
jgi:hypothetical protein